jgi:hypothetical protein
LKKPKALLAAIQILRGFSHAPWVFKKATVLAVRTSAFSEDTATACWLYVQMNKQL